jgi:hypothetical protein
VEVAADFRITICELGLKGRTLESWVDVEFDLVEAGMAGLGWQH